MANNSRGYVARMVTLLSLSIGFLYLDRLAISYMLPIIQPALQITNFQIGQINLATTLCLAISGIVFAMIADRTGKRKFWLAILSVATSIFAGLCIFATTFESLIFFRALVGIAEGPLLALTYTLVGHQDPKHYGRNIGFIAMAIGVLANIAGPIILTQLLGVVNWNLAFLLSAIPSLILALLIMKFVKEIEITPEEKERSGSLNLRQFGELFKYRNFVICCVIGMLHMTAYWLVIGYGPLYLTNVVGISVAQMGFISALAGIMVFPWLVLMPLSDKLGRKPVLFIAYICCVIPFIGIVLGGGSTVTVVLYIIFGMMPAVFTPIWTGVIPSESMPVHLQVTASAIVIACGDIVGGAIMSAVAGKIADIYGLASMFIIGAITMAVCFFLVFALKETRPRQLKVKPSDVVQKAS